MRALQLVDWKHDPELVEVAEPEPGPGEVRVRIGGAGACHSDLHLIDDFDGSLLPWGPPFTLGHENAGWVDALGPGATGVEVGEPVAVYGPWGCGRCHRCAQGMENYCVHQAEGAAGGGLGLDGGMAELMVVPDARFLVPIGDLAPADAAPLTDAGLTPYHAVKRSLPLLTPGTTAVVVGAGGLGHLAVQMLEALTPATIVAVDRRAPALELAANLGAHHTVHSGEGDAVAELRSMTGGVGADVVLDFVGTDDTLRFGAALARPLGHLTVVGIGGGTLPLGFFTVPYELSVATTYWGSRSELIEVVALATAGRIRPQVQVFTLDDAPRIYDAMRAGSIAGRAVVVPT